MTENRERPADLAEVLSLLRHPAGNLSPEDLIHLRDRVWRLARARLGRTDPLRREIDSEDLAQETLFHLVKHVHEFRGSSWGEFFGFVRTIIRQRQVDHARKNERKGRMQRCDLDAQPPLDVQTPSALFGDQEDRRRLRSLIEELPEMLREVLTLRLAGRDYDGIAADLDITTENARKRTSRALGLLRERWGTPDS